MYKKFLNKIIIIVERHKLTLLALIFSIIIIIYSIFDPYTNKYLPKCAFYTLTNYKCPGCGSQRAIHSLLNLDLTSALQQNPLFIILIPYIFSGVYIDIKAKKNKTFKKINDILYGFVAGWIIFFIILIYWITRNLPLYQHHIEN